MTVSQSHHRIGMITPLGKDYLILTSLEGEERMSDVFNFRLHVFSEDKNISPSKLLGKKVTFWVKRLESQTRFFNGIVSKFWKGPTEHRGRRQYIIEVVPWLSLLTWSSDCQIFQNKTAIQILEDVFQGFDFYDYDISALKKQYSQREYCTQYCETAFNFVSRLMEEEGIFYFFKHSEDKHTLILGDQYFAYADCQDPHIYSFNNTHLVPSVHQWDHGFAFCSGETSHTDYNFKAPDKDLLTKANTTLSFPEFKSYELFEFPGAYEDISPGEEKAKIRIEEQESCHEIIQGKGTYCTFFPGCTFNVQSPEAPSENGKYVVLSVLHKANDISHTTNPPNKANYHNSFTCILDGINFRPSRKTKKPVVIGPQSAIIMGPEKEEIYTDKYGRVKVKFFWDRKGPKDEKSSCWVRVNQNLAGDKWGQLFIPRVGQEVIVSFFEGDPDRPFIIGSAYNASHMPPYELPDLKTQMGLKTHSTKQGSTSEANELRFEDKKGKEEVYLHAQKDFKCLVENDSTLQVKHDQNVTIKKNRTLTIEEGNETHIIKAGDYSLGLNQGHRKVEINVGNDTLTISQGNQITKVSLGKSSLEAMQEIELTVGQNSVKIDQTGITLKGLMIRLNGTMIQANAEAMLQLKGGLTTIN